MDKIIARKRWFFLFSLLITVPGLLFTLATPFSGGTVGLKFSIDYTGGTIWEFRPESPADPLVVQAAVAHVTLRARDRARDGVLGISR